MGTREIARAEWKDFFDAFSRQHSGWLVAVEVAGAEIGAQIQGQSLRLRGITWEPGGSTIDLALETLAREHLTHMIHGPTHVWLDQTTDGADAALQIQSSDATSTLIRFRSAIRPEAVDGIASDERL
jgi:hypothetical protein